jgi:Predicted GTPase or GTP-binding protein
MSVLEPELSEWGGKTIVLPSPPNARVRDRDDRKIRREMGYSKYIMPPRDLTINLRDKPIINLPLFKGLTYDRSMLNLIRRVLGPTMYIEQWGDVAVAIGNVKEFHMKMLSNVNIAVLPMNWERGLLVALEDRENYLLTLGVLKRICYNTGRAVITVSRNFDSENEVSHIRLGMIRLNENFEEVEKVLYIGKLESMLQSQGIPIISK